MELIPERVKRWGDLVAFSHSVFALPFALVMVVAIHRSQPVGWQQLSLLVVCVVAARFAAMGFNRLVDHRIDAANERTRNRELPAGRVSRFEAAALVSIAAAVFVGASFALGRHCGVLSFPVLALLFGYSLMKRFSSLCHFVLGFALACAPGGVWYALTGIWSWKPVPLMAAVLLWVAGFDILYACQDVEFDRKAGLKSIPGALGVDRALWLAPAVHVVAVIALALFGYSWDMGAIFWCGVVLFAGLIASQHLVVRTVGLQAIDRVFFTRNGAASVVLFIFAWIDSIG